MKLSSVSSSAKATILTQNDDVPGCKFEGEPAKYTVEQLKRWIKCRGICLLSLLAEVLYASAGMLSTLPLCPGACFSKDPVNTGLDNLPGRLTGNFTGPGIAFLEAPVNFPDTYRARQNSGWLPISKAPFTLVRERRRKTWDYTYFCWKHGCR